MTKRVYQKSVAGRRITLNIPESDIAKAALIGGGNYSKGFRIAINDYYERMLAAKGLTKVATGDPDTADDFDFSAEIEPKASHSQQTKPAAQVQNVVGVAPKPEAPRSFDRVYTDIQPIDDDDEPWTQEELAELKAEQAKSWAAAERLEAARANAAKP